MQRPTLTEQYHEGTGELDRLPTAELLALMNAADKDVARAVGDQIPNIQRMVDACVAAIGSGRQMYYIGAGTSGRLGVLDASELPPTFGVSADLVQGIIAGGTAALTRSVEAAEDDPDAGARDLLAAGFAAGDVVLGIAASGRTPYVLGAVRKAKEVGGITGGISCTPDSELSKAVDFPIEPLPGPEIVAGSTRMRAGTATKMVLNMVSTAVMIRLGHVYGNLMVNVRPVNQKLAARARRIIMQATGVPEQRAAELLDTSGGSVRVAIVMEKGGLSRLAAEERLAQFGGRIRLALESLPETPTQENG
jgi:N-acetylmuramic acid 6-phosphate etherase